MNYKSLFLAMFLVVTVCVCIHYWLQQSSVVDSSTPVSPSPSLPASPAKVTRELWVFTQRGCNPCNTLKRTLEDVEITKRLQDYKITLVYKHEAYSLMQQYKVSSTPTTLVVKRNSNGGYERCGDYIIGAVNKSVFLKWLDRYQSFTESDE